MAQDAAVAESTQEPGPVLTTVDGVPLKVSLRRAQRRRKINGLLLVAPLFLFILLTFLFPIGDMLVRSFDNSVVGEELPRTVEAIQDWSGDDLPPESVYQAMLEDIKAGAETRTINRVGKRLNYELSGMSSLFRKSARKAKRVEVGAGKSFKDALIKIDKKWGNVATWRLIKRESGPRTKSYYLAALDMETNADGDMVLKDEKRQIYLDLFGRTLMLSVFITAMTIVLGYPIAYLMATLPTKTSNLLTILVLLPFWTSLLVRTSAWIALLQKEGIINDFLVWLGVIGEDGRLAMIHNATGTAIAMTHILLPFMVLPLFSVMKTISPTYMRAARSLGATPTMAFIRVYMPNTIPGIGAGGILVFIISIGYYITPALVGGTSGTFISNFIAYHVSTSLNWGLGAALGAILLMLILALYILYDKVVGIDNMKLG